METQSTHPNKNRILLIDDDFINREVMKNIFSSQYIFEEAENGLDGLHKINEFEDDLCAILLDVSMPLMNGLELLKHLSDRGIPSRIPIFLITSHDDGILTQEAYKLGVMDVVTKPVTSYVIRRRVQSVIELFQARESLSSTVLGQEQQLRENADTIDELHRGTIEALASAIEFRDVESGEHTSRIYDISKYLLLQTELGNGFTAEEIEAMAIASITHDVGKIAISDVILNKPGKLSAEEYEIMKTHTSKGAMLMEQLSQKQTHAAYRYAYDIALHHHERWDGNGYPDGLKGDEITVWAQVVSIADVYDALLSPRVYKKAFDPDQAVKMILNGECGVFSPRLLRCFLQVEPDLRRLYVSDVHRTSSSRPDEVTHTLVAPAQPSRQVMDVLLLMTAIKSAFDMIISANLTRNTYYMIDYDRFLTHAADYDGTFDELIAQGASTVPLSHRQQFIDAFSRESLLTAFAEGKKSVSLEHPQIADDGVVHMVNTTTLFMEDSRSGDVLEITLSRYIDEEWEHRKQTKELLTDALALAEQANSAKSDFLSRMSHDIRTPLNAIIGMSTIIAANIDDPEKIADCLVKIGTSSKFLLGLINDILDFSKIESGQLHISKAPFNLRELILDIENILNLRAAKKHQQFSVHVNDAVAQSYIGDEFRVRQVLINLTENAHKYTQEGGTISLTVDVRKLSEHHHTLQFVVEDNGIGIRKEFLRRLFDPFAQDEGAHQGAGLGLAISQNLVHLMNGELYVDSEPGKGSRFTMELPLEPSTLDGESIDSGMRVLVVDDELAVCEHTAILLDKMGVSAEIAVSGHQAIALIRKHLHTDHAFDVAIIDWKMPDLDGIETVRRIREIAGRNVLVVVMSAYDWSEIEAEAREAGVDLFLAKPILEPNLRTALACSEKLLQEHVSASFDGERILVAEDNLLNQEIIKTMLEMNNLQVDVVSNGLEAVEHFAQSSPGEYLTIFMDVSMPVMDGHEATRRIRASEHPEATTIPIYALTANAFHSDVLAAEASGMNGHLAKPINLSEVIRLLQRLRMMKK